MSHHRDRRRAVNPLHRLLSRLPGIGPGAMVREATDEEELHFAADAVIEQPDRPPMRVEYRAFSKQSDVIAGAMGDRQSTALDQTRSAHCCDWYLLDLKEHIDGEEKRMGIVILDRRKMIAAGYFIRARRDESRKVVSAGRHTDFCAIPLRKLFDEGFFVFSLKFTSGNRWYREHRDAVAQTA